MPFRIIITAMLLKDENALESYKTQYLSEKKKKVCDSVLS